jgi:hypothetical protein
VSLPTLTVSLGVPSSPGWLMGDAVDSILGVSTYLATVDYTAIDPEVVRRSAVRRGRNHQLDRVEAGRLDIRLKNVNGYFTPGNPSSPFYPWLLPMMPIRVQATFNAVTYDVFAGFVDDWPQRWTTGTEGDAYVDVVAIDAFSVFAIADVVLDRPQEQSGARIEALLDAIGWPASLRNIDPGESQVQELAGVANVLTHAQEVAVSEGGVFFIARDGAATFYQRTHATALDEANDTWGDSAAEKSYVDIETSHDVRTLYNDVTVTAPNLADQQVTDDASIDRYSPFDSRAPRSYTQATLLTSTAEMLTRAEFLLGQYKDVKLRVTAMDLAPFVDDAQWPRLLGYDLHDRVLVRKRPPSIDMIEQPSIIEGVQHVIEENIWTMRLALSATAYQQGQWMLGDAALSLLGQTTTLVSG